jgi:hypothetical protein
MYPYAYVRSHLKNNGYVVIENHITPTFFLIQRDLHLYETSNTPVTHV